MSGNSAEWTLRQLVLSVNPNDWYKAAALNQLCVAAYSPIGSDTSAAMRELMVATKRYCGDASEQFMSIVTPGILARAKAAGSIAAESPRLDKTNLKEGFSADDAQKIRQVLMDPELAPAWLLINHSKLVDHLEKLPAFASLNSIEREAGYQMAICSFGDDCKATNLYSLTLCVNTFEGVCGEGPFEKVVESSVGADRFREISQASRWLRQTISSGDLQALGLRKKS